MIVEIVVLEKSNLRLDKYLIDKTDFSRSKIQKLIANGNVLVNGNSVKVSYMVRKMI